MSDYRLKRGQERFQVVDGPLENREFIPGVIYQEIPEREAGRFEEVVATQPTTKKSKTAAEVDNA